MKIADCLAQVDELKPNTYDDAMKLRWLSELDGRIFYELVVTHVRDKVLPEKIDPIVEKTNEETIEPPQEPPVEFLDDEDIPTEDEPIEDTPVEDTPVEESPTEEEINEEDLLVDPPMEFFGYTDEDLDKELIAPFPYDSIYRNYIFALIDFNNGEADRYQATMSMFNSQYQEFCNYYNRTHKPISTQLKVF